MTRGSWTAVIGLAIFTMGTSIVTPLFPLYQQRFDLSDGAITLLFATYTATVVPTMLIMGNLSDRIGRKRVMLPAMASLSAASLVFSLADSVPYLFAGRVLQGLAIGGFLGVSTAFVVDHAHPERKAWAAAVAGLAFRIGFGLGPGLGGLIAQYSANPIHRPFQAHLILMIVAFAAVLATAETVTRRPMRIEIRVGVPKGQFAAFALFLAPAAFLMSFLDGTLLSIAPLYMVQELGVTNIAVVGLVGFLVLGTGGFTPFIARRMAPRTAVITGVLTSSACSLLVVGAAGVGSAAMVLVAAGLIGLLNGLILQGATQICGISVPIAERGKLISALYMCAYSGTIPTVGLGYLSNAVGITTALAVFSAVALCMAAFVVFVGGRAFREVVPYVEPAVVPVVAA